eukprot:2857392-Amphidinium_carterae.1
MDPKQWEFQDSLMCFCVHTFGCAEVVIQTEEEQQGLEPQAARTQHYIMLLALGEPSSDMDIPHLAYIPDP